MAIDVWQNKVEVGLRDLAAQSAYEARYGRDAVYFVQGDEGVEEHAMPGGRPIDRMPSGGSWQNDSCTAAFSTKTSTNYFVLSAGHCATTSYRVRNSWHRLSAHEYDVWSSFNGNSEPINNTVGSTDSMRFRVAQADTSNSDGWQTTTSLAGYHDDQPGFNICFYGQATGTQRCGQVYDKEYASWWNSALWGWRYLYNHRRLTEYLSQVGDSGAPYYQSGKAFGIHKGAQTSRSVYTHARYAASAHGVTLPV